jgi:hypothetical protein
MARVTRALAPQLSLHAQSQLPFIVCGFAAVLLAQARNRAYNDLVCSAFELYISLNQCS